MVDLVCAGPHVSPVVLGSLSYDPNATATPVNHQALCGDCGAVYAAAATTPELVPGINTDGTPMLDKAGAPLMAPNPDHCPPGRIPSALIVKRRNQAKDPSWTPPPHNYKDTPGK